MYKKARKSANLSIAEAAWRLHIGSRTLTNYENGYTIVPPEIALKMAEVYGQPALTARYCADYCPIGQIYAYPVADRELTSIVLGLIKEHNDVRLIKSKLIEIAEDGVISEDEVADFEQVVEELMDLEEKIEALKLWALRVLPVARMIRKRKEKAAVTAAR